jgi:hypothetical protein
MLTALALSLSINHAAIKAAQNKASLVVGTVLVFMSRKLKHALCQERNYLSSVGVSPDYKGIYNI